MSYSLYIYFFFLHSVVDMGSLLGIQHGLKRNTPNIDNGSHGL